MKWPQRRTRSEEWNDRAAAWDAPRDHKPVKSRGDNSPLCQEIADRAVCPVVTLPRMPGCNGRPVWQGNPAVAGNRRAPRSAMVNSQQVVQSGPKQRRHTQNAGEAPPHNQIRQTM
jgi:hypothetical protein